MLVTINYDYTASTEEWKMIMISIFALQPICVIQFKIRCLTLLSKMCGQTLQ